VIRRDSPKISFTKEDFPTLGRPTNDTVIRSSSLPCSSGRRNGEEEEEEGEDGVIHRKLMMMVRRRRRRRGGERDYLEV